MQIDRFGCVGNTIKVSAGHYFDLADPSPNDVDLSTIAAALSKICRFGGHCPRFYSVAEHSVHCVRVARSEGVTLSGLRAILLHDAAEAYVGDVVKPLKAMLPSYAEIESRVECAIAEKMLVNFDEHSGVIKVADRAMLKAEKVAMWPDDSERWEGFSDIETPDVILQYWCPERSEHEFLWMARCLGFDGTA